MVTGGQVPCDQDVTVCPVCLEAFKDPRFLDCHHTFCIDCIADIAVKSQDEASVVCPSCRKTTALPPGGVQDLHVNFYISRAERKTTVLAPPAAAADQLLCEVHVDEKLRLFCTPCRQPVGLLCKATEHDGHPTENLQHAEHRIKNRMALAEEIVRDKTKKYNAHLNAIQRRKEEAAKKQELVEESIRNSHATLVAAADKARDEVLRTLEKLSASVDQEYQDEMDQYRQTDKVSNAFDTHHQLTDVTAKSVVELVKLAKDLQLDTEMEESIVRGELERRFPDDEDAFKMRSVIHRTPQDGTISTLVKNAKSFMGSVVTTQVTVKSQPEVRVVEQFTRSENPNVRVFSLCHVDQDPPCVRVSYDHCGLEEKVATKAILETGVVLFTSKKDFGRVTYKRFDEGKTMSPPQEDGRFCTDTMNPSAGHFQLNNLIRTGRCREHQPRVHKSVQH
jgi:ribosomal protein S27E